MNMNIDDSVFGTSDSTIMITGTTSDREIVGAVSNLVEHSEIIHDLRGRSYTLVNKSFRLDILNDAHRIVDSIPVVLRGVSIRGPIKDGDMVAIRRPLVWFSLPMYPGKLHNRTTNSTLYVRKRSLMFRLSNYGVFLQGGCALIVIVVFFGLAVVVVPLLMKFVVLIVQFFLSFFEIFLEVAKFVSG